MTLYLSKKVNNGIEENIEFENKMQVNDKIINVLLNYFDKKYIRQILNRFYYYLSEEDKKNIENKVLGKIDKNILLYELSCLDVSYEYIDIEGILNFRLNNIKLYVEDIIDEEVEELIYQKEYEEFLHLMRFFISVQEPKCKILNIVCTNENTYELYDENLNVIKKGLVQAIANEINEQLTKDDILVSNILTIAPEKIVIHKINNIDNKELLKTIKSLFEDRISYCIGCQICLNKNN